MLVSSVKFPPKRGRVWGLQTNSSWTDTDDVSESLVSASSCRIISDSTEEAISDNSSVKASWSGTDDVDEWYEGVLVPIFKCSGSTNCLFFLINFLTSRHEILRIFPLVGLLASTPSVKLSAEYAPYSNQLPHLLITFDKERTSNIVHESCFITNTATIVTWPCHWKWL